MKNISVLNCCRNFFLILILAIALSCTKEPEKHFSPLSADDTGVRFSNVVKEDTVFNIIEYLYFYNGGGVCAGDVNNDGLVDLYFTSNQQINRLYINKGNMKFEDITEKAGVSGIGNWKTGATFGDVNNDGLLDIYVCGVGNYKSFNSQNQLLINNGDLTFSDKTEEYGLSFKGLSTQSSFFDYDLDGDLDFYLLNHSVHSVRSIGSSTERETPDSLAGDRFYRNDLIKDGVKNSAPHFTDVTSQVGISSGRLGYGLGIAVSDLNMDGYPDLYISNDFQENDFLYLNQKDGRFKQVLEKSMGHSSRFSMGNDAADFNNDLRPDVVTLDMLPREESIIKTSAGDDPYEIYKYKLSSGFHYQTARNCLQLNRFITDSSVVFSDISILAGVEATDWSWSPLFVDFDNDGLKDLFISNGIQRRPNDMDYISFISNDVVQNKLEVMNQEDLSVIDQMPSGKVSNFLFQNRGDLTFSDVTNSWGLSLPSLSSGTAYADLDNDGDLDLVINNLNDVASVYRNNSSAENSFLKLILKGEENKWGMGVKVFAYADGISIMQEVSSSRGFLSSSDLRPNFGFGKKKTLDSLLVVWPSGKFQKLSKVALNTALTIQEKDAVNFFNYKRKFNSNTLLTKNRSEEVPLFRHKENNYNAFNTENLMPQMLSAEGPAMAVADVNADGVEDVFVGGGKGQVGVIFIQFQAGFKKASQKFLFEDSVSEDVDAAFFDADNDGDNDLVVVSGGQEVSKTAEELRPRLYLNDGNGNFKKVYFTGLRTNASCVKPQDFDRDGDIDLFIGSSTMPMLYGMSPPSFIMVNDGHANFQPVANFVQGATFVNMPPNRPGMVKDASWCDLNKDSLPDLLLVGEWMPITVLIQQPNHQFVNQTNLLGLEHSRGWWNTIAAADIDKDGDLDFVVGNQGQNSRLKASVEKPLRMILGDLDGNGSSDHILVYFNGEKSYPFASRDQLIKQLPYLKKKFLKYSDYRNVTVEDIVAPSQVSQTTELRIEEMNSVLLRNDGSKFTLLPLPIEAQMATVQAICLDDVNDDGNIDILLGGNLMAVQTELGPYDASIGLLLTGDGKGNFKAVDASKSGVVIQGEVRGISKIKNAQAETFYLVSRNSNSIVGLKKTKQ